jgi:hypothetical protein
VFTIAKSLRDHGGSTLYELPTQHVGRGSTQRRWRHALHGMATMIHVQRPRDPVRSLLATERSLARRRAKEFFTGTAMSKQVVRINDFRFDSGIRVQFRPCVVHQPSGGSYALGVKSR